MATHIIHKQKVHLQTNMSADAFALQNRISNLLKNDMTNKLEALFNKVSPNGKIIRIDKLEIDLGTVNKQNLETEFSEKLLEQLSNALSDFEIKNGDTKFTEIEHNKSLIDSLIYFLNNGYRPWYNVVKNFNDLEIEMLRSFSEIEWELLIEELRRDRTLNKNVIKRMVMQFSDSFLEKILVQLHNALNKKTIDALIERFGRVADISKRSLYKLFWEKAITVALTAINENDFTVDLIKKFNEDIDEFKLIKSEAIELKENKIKRKDESVGEEFFTENCGVVILHPFLLMYFQELGLLKENTFINTEMQYRAVLLLYYLSTGQTEAPEYNLLLEKLLCAIDFDEPVPNYIELTDKEKEESANLLKAVTQHWKPLNGTSAEGLQSSFLQREGKLVRKETGWQLQVEQKTIDILLDKLPWGIGTIKLPWMKHILNVEWC